MENLNKTIVIMIVICLIVIVAISFILLINKNNLNPNFQKQSNQEEENNQEESTIDWKSDIKDVQAVKFVFENNIGSSLTQMENALLTYSAEESNKYGKDTYEFSDKSTVCLSCNDEKIIHRISVPFPEYIEQLSNQNIDVSKYNDIDLSKTYKDCVAILGANGVLICKYFLNEENNEMYNYYWIKDRNNYLHINFYKSTGKILSLQKIIDGKQRI